MIIRTFGDGHYPLAKLALTRLYELDADSETSGPRCRHLS